MATELRPRSFADAAAALAGAAADGRAVRILGAGTKWHWGQPLPDADVIVQTSRLDHVVEHNAGDLTAVLEAGVPLARAQELFAGAGQMLALDPPLGVPGRQEATIGGVIATGDAGPLRHRYGAPRDLVLGMTVALSDGTIARSGGKVIKNVAGYDVAKLFAGSFGTLGLILSVAVRLHPLPVASATAIGSSDDPDVLARAARAIAAAPLELESLDVAWRGGRGGILARSGGVEALRRAERVADLMRQSSLADADVVADDDVLWARQRAGQRSADAVIVRVSARPSGLAELLRAVEGCSGTLVGRAALGVSYVELAADAVGGLRQRLAGGASTVLLDRPAGVGDDPWAPVPDPGTLGLMNRIKDRFDPGHTCNPGVFVGGI